MTGPDRDGREGWRKEVWDSREDRVGTGRLDKVKDSTWLENRQTTEVTTGKGRNPHLSGGTHEGQGPYKGRERATTKYSDRGSFRPRVLDPGRWSGGRCGVGVVTGRAPSSTFMTTDRVSPEDGRPSTLHLPVTTHDPLPPTLFPPPGSVGPQRTSTVTSGSWSPEGSDRPAGGSGRVRPTGLLLGVRVSGETRIRTRSGSSLTWTNHS